MHKNFGKVAVLMGGGSSEREISLQGGKAVLSALCREGVDAIGIDAGIHLFEDLTNNTIQRVFIMLHGKDGEDGKVQAALEEIGVAYTGSGIYASELAFDKVRCKKIWLNQGLSTPDFFELNEETNWQEVISDLGIAFVKPVQEGSSIGISKASNSLELKEAYYFARQFDKRVIAEKWIDGAEFTVAILDDQVLPVIELKTKNEFYDYEAKYESKDTEYLCPCDLDEQKIIELNALAKTAYDSLECYGWGRVDVMQDGAGKFWLLEVNTVPGMTEKSLVPMAANYVGTSFDNLVIKILESSDLLRRGLK